MGSDIHMIVQRERDGVWITLVGEGYKQRNKILFDVLVYGDYETGMLPIAPNRGLPDGIDNSDERLGNRSFSHCTLREVLDYDWTQVVYEGTNDCATLREWCEVFLKWIDSLLRHGDPENIRLVFGFDH